MLELLLLAFFVWLSVNIAVGLTLAAIVELCDRARRLLGA